MKNLVTGGAGFLGSHLIRKLIENNEEVICLDNLFTGRSENIKAWENNDKFKFINHDIVDPIELIIHRTVWTSFLLLFTISIYSKWNDVLLVLKNIKKTLILFICGILIVTNWFTWIYAVVTNNSYESVN